MELKKSRRSLERAKNYFHRMKNSKTLDEFEENWIDFLNYTEKIWNKSTDECRSFENKFNPWREKKYNTLRKKDPLLKYIKTARGSDQHSVKELVKKNYGGTSVKSKELGKSVVLRNISFRNCELIIGGGENYKVEYTSSKVEAISFVNRGVTYNPPISHLGVALSNSKDPFEIAELAIVFYEKYLSDIESAF